MVVAAQERNCVEGSYEVCGSQPRESRTQAGVDSLEPREFDPCTLVTLLTVSNSDGTVSPWRPQPPALFWLLNFPNHLKTSAKSNYGYRNRVTEQTLTRLKMEYITKSIREKCYTVNTKWAMVVLISHYVKGIYYKHTTAIHILLAIRLLLACY